MNQAQSSEGESRRFRNAIPEVMNYSRILEQQDLIWESVSLLANIHHKRETPQLLEAIASAHTQFRDLREHLLDNITRRHLDKVSIELQFKAQTVIDILVRNLFERTADVGFLATDPSLIEFMAAGDFSESAADEMRARLRHYQAKYTVYDDIILLDRTGRVILTFNPNNRAQHDGTPFVQRSLKETHDYVEYFGPSGLVAHKPNALLYGRALAEDSGQGPVVGALVLSFNLTSELDMIFDTLIKPGDRTVIGLIDAQGQLIASSDPVKLPPGSSLSGIRGPGCQVIQYQHDTYFVHNCVTRGFQGYQGLPWRGAALVPVAAAFRSSQAAETVLTGKQQHASELFPRDLNDINLRIRSALRIVILNGKIVSFKKNLRTFLPILDTFQSIGEEVGEVFGDSIRSVHSISLQTAAAEAEYSALLAGNILDRNLYERANDCRWWALDPVFRQILSEPAHGSTEQERCHQVLRYINDLYTVYTNLLLYDREGCVFAVSAESGSHLIGMTLGDRREVQACLRLPDPQQYAVSNYEPTPLYDNRPTYVYHAAVRHSARDSTIVGGIGIVFDSADQLPAILEDTVPRDGDGEIRAGALSAFCSSTGEILEVSRNDLGIAAGSRLTQHIDQSSDRLRGSGTFSVNVQGRAYVLGFSQSRGYREFKTTDGYVNGIVAITLLPS